MKSIEGAMMVCYFLLIELLTFKIPTLRQRFLLFQGKESVGGDHRNGYQAEGQGSDGDTKQHDKVTNTVSVISLVKNVPHFPDILLSFYFVPVRAGGR